MHPQILSHSALLAATVSLLSSCTATPPVSQTSAPATIPRRLSHTYDLRYVLPQPTATRPVDPDMQLPSLVDNFWSTLDHDAWRAHGGTRDDLHLVGDRLIVTTSPENLLTLDTALGEFYFSRGLAIFVDARAYLVPAALIDKAQIVWSLSIPTTFEGTPESGSASILDHPTLSSFLDALAADTRFLSFTAPRLTTPNAYRVNLLLDLAYPDEPRPVTATVPARLPVPVSTYLAFNFAPIVSADRRYIVCEFSDLQISHAPPPAPPASTRPANFNDPNGRLVSIPDGGTLLVGKMLKSDPPQSAPSTCLLVFIRPNLTRGSEGFNPNFHAAGGIFDQLEYLEPRTVNDLLWALHDPAATPPVDHSRPTGLPPSQPQR